MKPQSKQRSFMKILFFTNNFTPQDGGVARFGANICRELCRRGHKVDVLSSVKKINRDLACNLPYVLFECKSKKFSRFASLPVIAKTLTMAKRKYDLFFMGTLITTSALGLYLISFFRGIPYVVLLNGYDISYLWSKYFWDRLMARLLLRGAGIILVNSNWMKQQVISKGFQDSKVKVLNPGVNTEFFVKSDNQKKLIVDENKFKSKNIILTVSRLVEIKGHKYVIEALSKLINDIPDIHYLIIGEGPEKDALVKLTVELGVSDHVTFIGNVCADDDILTYYYSISKVFVMPSISVGKLQEGFGMVYLEANACGIPVIGSRTGGIADAVVDGETGILVEEKDVLGLSEKIKLLLKDNDLRAKMGEAGRKRAEKYFSWEAVGEKMEEYLRNVVSR